MKYLLLILALTLGIYKGATYVPKTYYVEMDEFNTDEIVRRKLEQIGDIQLREKYYSQGEIQGIIYDYFGKDSEAALAIARCESSLNPNAINEYDSQITGMNSWGLFMHNEKEFAGWNDPKVSTAKAYEKFSKRGWRPWYLCSKKLGLI